MIDEGFQIYLISGIGLIVVLAGVVIYQNIKHFKKKKGQPIELKKKKQRTKRK